MNSRYLPVPIGALLSAATLGSAVLAAPFDPGDFHQAFPDILLTGTPYGYLNCSRSTAGDLNGDGKPELIIGSLDGTYVLQNGSLDPNSDTSPFVSTHVASTPALGVATGDVDGDGRSDIVASIDGGFSVIPNRSSGGSIAFGPSDSFIYTAGLGIAGPNHAVAVQDFDGDGAPDVCWPMADWYQPAAVRNTSALGVFSFDGFLILPGNNGGAYNNVLLADLDRDGRMDFWSMGLLSTGFHLNRSDLGTLAFDTVPGPPFGPVAALADVDGDGRLETLHRGTSGTFLAIDQWAGEPGAPPSFAGYAFVQCPEIEFTTDIKSGDLDGDGRADLVLIAPGNEFSYLASPPFFLHVWRSSATPGGLQPTVFDDRLALDLGGLWPTSCTVEDFNGDGKKDIAVVGLDLAASVYVVRTFLNRAPVAADTTPPVIHSINASPSILWPPNNKLVSVVLSLEVTDASPFTSEIESVTSNQALGQGAVILDGPLSLRLQASRTANQGTRIYEVMVRCTDTAGNTSEAPVSVFVPHDVRVQK